MSYCSPGVRSDIVEHRVRSFVIPSRCAGTLLVVISMTFGAPVRNMVESMVFLLAVRPFDVGERINLNDPDLFPMKQWVEEIRLMSTTFRSTVGKRMIVPNYVLANMPIINLSVRSQLHASKRSPQFIYYGSVRVNVHREVLIRNGSSNLSLALTRRRSSWWRLVKALHDTLKGTVFATGNIVFRFQLLIPLCPYSLTHRARLKWKPKVDMYAYQILKCNSVVVAVWLTSQHTHAQTGIIYANLNSVILYVRDTVVNLGIKWAPPRAPVLFTEVEGASSSNASSAVTAPGSATATVPSASPVAATAGTAKPADTADGPAPLSQFGRRKPAVTIAVPPVAGSGAGTSAGTSSHGDASASLGAGTVSTTAVRVTSAVQTVNYAEASTQTERSFDWNPVPDHSGGSSQVPTPHTGMRVLSSTLSPSAYSDRGGAPGAASTPIASVSALHSRILSSSSSVTPASGTGQINVVPLAVSVGGGAVSPPKTPTSRIGDHQRAPSGHVPPLPPPTLAAVTEDDDSSSEDEDQTTGRHDPGDGGGGG